MSFKHYINEEFNQEEFVKAAAEWLKGKFGDSYEFIHKPNLNDPDKTYYASIYGKHFGITGKRFDTNGDGNVDTILYKIINSDQEEEEPEGF